MMFFVRRKWKLLSIFCLLVVLFPVFLALTQTEGTVPQDGVSVRKLIKSDRTFTVPNNDVCPAIDLVYLWVNGTDPYLVKLISDVTGKPYVETGRLRDIPTLKYSMRAAATFAPFLRKIVIVTNGQYPQFVDFGNNLDLDENGWLKNEAVSVDGKVRVVLHKQIFDDPRALPTFNSNAIEAMIANIPGIAPCWFYQNDDFAFGRPVRISEWIDLGTGEQQLAFDSWRAPEVERMRRNIWHASVGNSNKLLNDYYNPKSKTEIRHNYEGHNTRLFQQRIMHEIHMRWFKEFNRTSFSKFRQREDTALPFLYQNVCLEEFGGKKSSSLRRQFNYDVFVNSPDTVRKTILDNMRRGYISWCLNDAAGIVDTKEKREAYDHSVDALVETFEQWFPMPASWEKHPKNVTVIPSTLEEYGQMMEKMKRNSLNGNQEETTNTLTKPAADVGRAQVHAEELFFSFIYRVIIVVWLLAICFVLLLLIRSCFPSGNRSFSASFCPSFCPKEVGDALESVCDCGEDENRERNDSSFFKEEEELEGQTGPSPSSPSSESIVHLLDSKDHAV